MGISVLLGLLVGLQRQHVTTAVPGVRTFALITVLGTVSAQLAQRLDPWVLAAGMLGISQQALSKRLKSDNSKVETRKSR